MDHPVPGWFEAVEPQRRVADWEMTDFVQTGTDGTSSIKTKICGPGGAVGIMYQSFDPATRSLTMRSVYLDQLPKWIAEGPQGRAMVPGKGVPTVTYLLNRQWKMLGVEYGGLKTVKLSMVEEARSVIELAVLLDEGVPLDAAVMRTHTTEYARTALTQSGHRIAAARAKLFRSMPLDAVLERLETPKGSLLTTKQRKQRDPNLVARHGDLIAEYGKGKITRKTVVQTDFDIEYDLVPFYGEQTHTQP